MKGVEPIPLSLQTAVLSEVCCRYIFPFQREVWHASIRSAVDGKQRQDGTGGSVNGCWVKILVAQQLQHVAAPA